MTMQRAGHERKFFRWVLRVAVTCLGVSSLAVLAGPPPSFAQAVPEIGERSELSATITTFRAKQRKAGDYKVVVKVVTSNIGPGAARAPFSISMFLSDDAVLDVTEDALLSTAIITEDLLPAATTDGIKLRRAGLPQMNGFVIVSIDADNAVAESDEENNILVRQIAGTPNKSILQFAHTDIPETPFIAVQDNGATLFLEHNALQDRVDAATFVSEDRDILTLWVGKEGFPTRAAVSRDLILFANYSSTTVDIAVISEDGQSQLFRDTPLDDDAQAFVADLAAEAGMAPRQLSLQESVVTRALITEDSASLTEFKSFRRALSFVGSLQPLQELKSEIGSRLMKKLGNFIAKKLAEREDSERLVEILNTTWDCVTETRVKVAACVKGVVGSIEDLRDIIDTPKQIAQLQELLRAKVVLQDRSALFPDELNPSDPNDPFNQRNQKERPIPGFTITPSQTIAVGETASLDGFGSGAVEPGDFITEWRWEVRSPNDENVTSLLSECCEAQTTTGTLSEVGTYLIFLTVTDNNGLQNTKRKAVRVQPVTLGSGGIPEPMGDGPCDRDISGHYENDPRTARSFFDFTGNACSGTGSQVDFASYNDFEYTATPPSITVTYMRRIECVTIAGKSDFGNWIEATVPAPQTFNFVISDSGLRIFDIVHTRVNGVNVRPQVGTSCQ